MTITSSEKTGLLVTFYRTNYNTYDQLRRLLTSLAFTDYFVVLATHSPVPEDIQDLCDIFIFEYENVADQRRWSHGVAETSLIKKGLSAMKEVGINWTFKLCYDSEFSDFSILNSWVKEYRYKFVSCKWGDKIVSTNSFFANIDFVLSTFSFFSSIEEMFKRSFFIEEIWNGDVFEKNLLGDIFCFETKEEMFGPNRMDTKSFSYTNLVFRFEEPTGMFYIDNLSENFVIGNLSIIDYYSDLSIYNSGINLGNGSMWVIPNDIYKNNNLPKNGYYIEITDEQGEVFVRRNLDIGDFGYRHKFHKIHNIIRREVLKFSYDSKYLDFVVFSDLKKYEKFNLKKLNIRTFIDAKANVGMFALAMIEFGAKKCYLLESEINSFGVLKKAFDTEWTKVFNQSFNRTIDHFFNENVTEDQIDLIRLEIGKDEYEEFDEISDHTINRCNNFLIEYRSNTNYNILKIINKLTKNGFNIFFNNKELEIDNQNFFDEEGLIFATKKQQNEN